MKKLTKAQAQARASAGARIRNKGAPVGEPVPVEPEPARVETYTRDQVQMMLEEAIWAAAPIPDSRPKRLLVNRDDHGFIESVDIVPVTLN